MVSAKLFSSTSVHTSQRLHLVTLATMLIHGSFLCLNMYLTENITALVTMESRMWTTEIATCNKCFHIVVTMWILLVTEEWSIEEEIFSTMMIMPCYGFGLWASELIMHVDLWVGASVWREPGPSVFSLKMEVVDLTMTLVTTCRTIWWHDPGSHVLNFHHCENLESEIYLDMRWRWVVASSLLYPQGGLPLLTIG